MGFMDKMKDAMGQAQEASKKMGSTMSAGMSPATADYAQLANKLGQSGVPCTAEIVSVSETGRQDMSGKQYSIEVKVEGNGEPYEATVEQFILEDMASSYSQGSRWQAKADPDDRSRLLLFGQA
jgi:hypothetical protein